MLLQARRIRSADRLLREDSLLNNQARRMLIVSGLSFLFFCAFFSGSVQAQAENSLAQRIQNVVSRPEFAHANFGIEFYSLDTGKVVYALNGDKLFVPASTTKTLTEGTVLAKLGADYRFHTRVYRTGSVDKHGTLKGDLILVASGDPNLSNRIQPDGTLAFVDEDHSYGGPALPGDPLVVIKQLARDVASKGIRKIDGRVLIDTSLFPDGPREGGTDVVMSSIMVNDNVIDVVAKPGVKAGDPLIVTTSPESGYTHFTVNAATTAAGTAPIFNDPQFANNPDGSVSIALSGSLPVGIEAQTVSIGVPSPTIFAQWVLRESLGREGIEVKGPVVTVQPDFVQLAHSYTEEN